MPWIHEDNRGNKPHNVRRAERDNYREESAVGEECRKGERIVLNLLLNGPHSYEDRSESEVNHDENPEIHHRHV